ncbi:M23 family metallopeptidase [Candidatus Saccharibacteria bacterium]|nr:M23 family metallopeptidase [Candidatus Saccharibacteria bacterium]
MEYVVVSLLLNMLHGLFFQPLQIAGQAVSTPSQAEMLPTQLIPEDDDGGTIKPFLTLPFTEKDMPRDQIKINEGWFYSDQEQSIHGLPLHRGIDFNAARHTPVVAAADGYAIRSYQASVLDRTYEGKPVGYALGEFVQIWHPDSGVYTLYAHLQEAEDDLAYAVSEPVSNTAWNPTGIYVNTDEFMRIATPVKRGQVIGTVGDSGITWGYTERFDTQSGHLYQRDTTLEPSWDETHLHFEVYTRSANGLFKDLRFDPYGIYGQVKPDHNDYTQAPLAATLWLLDDKQFPRYP